MPRPKLTGMENFVKTGCVVFEISDRIDKETRTDRFTDRHVHRNTSHPYQGRSKVKRDINKNVFTSMSSIALHYAA